MPVAKEYTFPFYRAGITGLLSNSDYYDFLIHKIRNARKSILAAVFIVNTRKSDDKERKVLALLKELINAKWRGVDAKLVLGSSDQAPVISIANEITFQYLTNRDFPVRYAQVEGKSLHSKYLIIDKELIILGSHNWTHNAFFLSREDSVFCYSKDGAVKLTKEFYYLWASGEQSEL